MTATEKFQVGDKVRYKETGYEPEDEIDREAMEATYIVAKIVQLEDDNEPWLDHNIPETLSEGARTMMSMGPCQGPFSDFELVESIREKYPAT